MQEESPRKRERHFCNVVCQYLRPINREIDLRGSVINRFGYFAFIIPGDISTFIYPNLKIYKDRMTDFLYIDGKLRLEDSIENFEANEFSLESTDAAGNNKKDIIIQYLTTQDDAVKIEEEGTDSEISEIPRDAGVIPVNRSFNASMSPER